MYGVYIQVGCGLGARLGWPGPAAVGPSGGTGATLEEGHIKQSGLGDVHGGCDGQGGWPGAMRVPGGPADPLPVKAIHWLCVLVGGLMWPCCPRQGWREVLSPAAGFWGGGGDRGFWPWLRHFFPGCWAPACTSLLCTHRFRGLLCWVTTGFQVGLAGQGVSLEAGLP